MKLNFMGCFKATLIIAVAVPLVPFTAAFDRAACADIIRQHLGNGSLARDDNIFFRNEKGNAMSDVNNLTLTLSGCQQLCGSRPRSSRSFYLDVGPRSSIWMLPLVLLISNLTLPVSLVKKSYLMILHLLGDPIDSTWSLLTKIEAWNRCYALASQKSKRYQVHDKKQAKARAVIFAAIEEIYGPEVNPRRRFWDAVAGSNLSDENFNQLCVETASAITDSRSVEIFRAVFSIVLYGVIVLLGFSKSSGDPIHLVETIGTVLIFSWMVPLMLLSNAIGKNSPGQIYLRILVRFAKRAGEEWPKYLNDTLIGYGRQQDTTSVFAPMSQPQSVDCYRRYKQLFNGSQNDHSSFLLLFLSTLPVAFSVAAVLALMWQSPQFAPSCHPLHLILICLMWFISAYITYIINQSRLPTEGHHRLLILIKDSVITGSYLSFMVLSSIGFNSYWCWSGMLIRGSATAYVALNLDKTYQQNLPALFFGVVTACFGLQLFAFGLMLWPSQNGLSIMRWDEKGRSSSKLNRVINIWPGQKFDDSQAPVIQTQVEVEETTKFFDTFATPSPSRITTRLLSAVYRLPLFAISPLVTAISKVTRIEQVLESAPPTGKKRLEWTCTCGHRGYDYFVHVREDTTDELERLTPEKYIRKHAGTNMQGRREGLAYKTFASVTNFWQSRTSSASATLPMHQIQPQLAQTQQIAPTHEIQSEPLFLLLCIKSCQFEFATNLVQLRACDLDSDQACFAKLRDIYEQIRGKWIRKFSLRTLTSIKFVQFELYNESLVDIQKQDDIPPVTDEEYLYAPKPPKIVPPIGSRQLMHLYSHPSHAHFSRSPILARFPKKRVEALSPCPVTGVRPGWGIYFEEGLYWNKILIAGFVALVIGGLAFGICWSVLEKDIQGGFAIAAYVIALVMFGWGSVQALY